MSKLHNKKSGSNKFGSINTQKKGGTAGEFASILAREAVRMKLNPKIGYAKLVAQGVGTVEAEGGFDGSLWTSNPAQLGPYAMNSSYGSVAQRLDKVASSRIALQHWKSDGESWVPGWWHWEDSQGEAEDGLARSKKYEKMAEQALKGVGITSPGGGGGENILEEALGIPGDILGGAESAVNAGEEVGEFLGELAETLFNFKKLGALAASAMAWFLKLILKAIWDYIVHPALDWVERATSWYWTNFFGTGTEQGSGFGYVLRSNAGIVTIGFWALGYGALFTDGSSLSPVGKASDTLLGHGFKSVEGKVARRSLVKPSEVKEKTPDKPEPKASTIPIQRAQTFSVGRKRAVSVTSGSTTKVSEGRKPDARSQRQVAPVPRPQKRSPEQSGLILPDGVKTPAQIKAKATLTTKPGRTGVGPRSGGGNSTPVPSGTGGGK